MRRPVSPDHRRVEQDRIATMLVALVAFVVLLIGVTFLIMISIRLLIGLGAAVGLLAVYAGVHYVTWGRNVKSQLDDSEEKEQWWQAR